MGESQKKVCIVVLGDIGRSPRMTYHALSFADEGHSVELIGYAGSRPAEKLLCHPKIKLNYMWPCPEFKKYLPTVLAHGSKVLWQVVTLFVALLFTCFPHFVLVQNPPGVPALGVCYVYCKIFRAKFVIDWHNYAYSILALSLGLNHKLVKLSRGFEFYFGRKSDGNMCVTKAMKEDLKMTHGINAVTFYDRPPDIFRKITIKEKHDLFLSLGIEYPAFIKGCSSNETRLTRETESSETILREDRPALIISSTSWTEDEDFSILIQALEYYEHSKEAGENLPTLICCITGKGPLKEFYLRIIEGKKWKHVEVLTLWLESKDYPVFLACGDLGISLHTSSSGLDLPMKVVDMFGCELPVCSVDFNCISELVRHNENGFIFKDAEEMTEQLRAWFTGFPTSQSLYHIKFKENLQKFQSLRWHNNWIFNIKPMFKS